MDHCIPIQLKNENAFLVVSSQADGFEALEAHRVPNRVLCAIGSLWSTNGRVGPIIFCVVLARETSPNC